jgi:hypothetical protein
MNNLGNLGQEDGRGTGELTYRNAVIEKTEQRKGRS